MTSSKNALAREDSCEQQEQQLVAVLDHHEVKRRAALALVPKMPVAIPKQGKQYLLFMEDVRKGLVEVFEAFEDEGVPHLWVRFIGREHHGTMMQLRYVSASNSPGWRDVKDEPLCTAGYYCARHSGAVYSFR